MRRDPGLDILRVSRRERPEHQPYAGAALHNSADRVIVVRHFRDRRLHRPDVRLAERRVHDRSLQERAPQTNAAKAKQKHVPRSVWCTILSLGTAADSAPLPKA